MTESLARTEETVDELVQISEGMRRYLETEHADALQTTIERLNQRPGLVRRFFPTAYDAELQRLDVAKLRATADAKEALFTLYSEIRMEIARKQGDALIKATGTHLQAQLTDFALQKMNEITKSVGNSRRTIMASFKEQLADIEEHKDIPDLYRRAKASLVRQQEGYFASLDTLLDGFVQALDTKVNGS
jgi:hypothetical protein